MLQDFVLQVQELFSRMDLFQKVIFCFWSGCVVGFYLTFFKIIGMVIMDVFKKIRITQPTKTI
jgi:hypothetical protein